MRDSRIGECLWREWSGNGYSPSKDSSILFFTEEHVSLDHDVVRRALASALQRDGTVITLGSGFNAIENGVFGIGFAGYVDGDDELTICDENGETFYGDSVEEVVAITWVEIYVGAN